MPSLRRPRPTEYATAAFTAGAIGFGAWHALTPFFAAWTPNLGASCLEIAATIAIVDRIVRNETDRHVQPRRDAALRFITNRVAQLLIELDDDYIATHEDAISRPRPTSAAQVLAEHAAGIKTETSTRQLRDGPPPIAMTCADTAERLERIATVERDLLDPPFVLALDVLATQLANVAAIANRHAGKDRSDPDWLAMRTAQFVNQALTAFLKNPDVTRWINLDDQIDEWAPVLFRSEDTP